MTAKTRDGKPLILAHALGLTVIGASPTPDGTSVTVSGTHDTVSGTHDTVQLEEDLLRLAQQTQMPAYDLYFNAPSAGYLTIDFVRVDERN